eukprot:CAMPEP_0113705404 /NCGR_PEP_ID=MMETSP0038_2-20120614/27116_1 /TAXON_ID=2898 /ORGANISM="Cryptomonas paramecium" /LENGTH=64 /DNA_ID=CAMNT_0000630413 /DNA_START=389 /DNA_END=580 /DNA_ORIENTATION=- /assembly_acc=CAM_ASM_000170
MKQMEPIGPLAGQPRRRQSLAKQALLPQSSSPSVVLLSLSLLAAVPQPARLSPRLSRVTGGMAA